MKSLFAGLMLLGSAAFAAEGAAVCSTYVAKCVCYPAIPFEGFAMYVYEKCDAVEGSYKYGEQNYDTQAQCEAEILKDQNCQSLN